MLSHFSCVPHQAPLSMGFSRQEYWNGLPCLLPGYLPNPGTEPVSPTSPASKVDSLLLSHQGSPLNTYFYVYESQGASLVAQLVKHLPAMWETWVSSLNWEFPGEGNGYPLQYSGLENCVDCIVYGVTTRWTQLSDFHWER